MAYPDKPVLDYSYTGFQQSQGDDSFPGTQVDNDLADLKTAIDATIDFIQTAIRSDGALTNGVVTFDSLNGALQALLGDAAAIEDLSDLVDTATSASTSAGASETAAAASATGAQTALASFDLLYLGPKASDPTVNNVGGALTAGEIYYNTSTGLKIYSGSAWAAYSPVAGISDLVVDTTPQLGGDLDLNSHVITGMVLGVDVQAYDADTTKNDVANSFTAKQTFSDFAKFQRVLETVTVVADNPASGDNNFDVLTSCFRYFTVANDTNWTFNIRGDGTHTLNSLMAAGEALTVAAIVTNTTTAYYMSAFKIDGNAVTPQWLSNAAPTAGTVSKRDTYTFTIIKTADATFIVQASFARGN